MKIRLLLVATYESGRVVVTRGLGVTEGLQYGVGLHNLILQSALPETRSHSQPPAYRAWLCMYLMPEAKFKELPHAVPK